RWPLPSWRCRRGPSGARARSFATASAPATSTWAPPRPNCSAQAGTRSSTSRTSTRPGASPRTATRSPCTPRLPTSATPSTHPSGGDLAYPAFSGSHQDAIKKGFEALGKDYALWEVPYLPIDPHHVGRSYEAVIRVNSQSGKGGVAYIMKFEHGLDLPRRLQIEFSSVIQKLTEASGTEISADQIWESFESTYLKPVKPVALLGHPILTTAPESGETTIEATLKLETVQRVVKGRGNGPIAAFVDALSRDAGMAVEITDYSEHALGEGADARAPAYVESP